jgi:hypothetical protein
MSAMSSGDIGRDDPKKTDVDPPGASAIIPYEMMEMPSNSGTNPSMRRMRNVAIGPRLRRRGYWLTHHSGS